jgi:hypothetical protein
MFTARDRLGQAKAPNPEVSKEIPASNWLQGGTTRVESCSQGVHEKMEVIDQGMGERVHYPVPEMSRYATTHTTSGVSRDMHRG